MRWRTVFRRRNRDADIDRELAFHIQHQIDDYVAAGLPRDEATRRTRIEFGGVQQVTEDCRDVFLVRWWDDLTRDVRVALRGFSRSPGFFVATVATLALAIGITTTVFSVADAVLLRPLSYPNQDRLVVVSESTSTRPDFPVNAMHFLDWRKDLRSFDEMAMIRDVALNLTRSGGPELLSGARVSSSLFAMLGTRMQLGRTFTGDEDLAGRDRVVILNDSLWRRRFGADPQVVGQTILLNEEPYQVVGVLPRNFHFPWLRHLISLPTTAPRPEIWKPYGLREAERNPVGQFNNIVLARLRPGATIAQATVELGREQADISSRLPQQIDLRALVKPLQTQIVGGSRTGIQLLLAAAAVVLLIGCINITNLLIVRALARRREFAVRRTVGAARTRLVQQMLLESVTLCALGGLAGAAIACLMIRAIVALAPPDIPRLDEVSMDARVLLFALVLTTVVAVMVGVLPALRSARADVMEALSTRPGSARDFHGSSRVRSLLVASEVALTVVCLTAGGLLAHSLLNLVSVDTGLNVDGMLTAVVNISGPRHNTFDQRTAVRRAMLDRLQRLPGAQSVAMAHNLPLTGIGANSALSVEGTTVPLLERPVADARLTNAEYFCTWGIPLRAGRLFDDRDVTRPVVIVSEFTARRLWPGTDAIGRRLRLGANSTAPLLEVIGVVGDVRSIRLEQPPSFAVYVPYWQQDAPFATFAVKTSGDVAPMAAAVRDAIHQVDTYLPVTIRPMTEVVDQSTAERRFQMQLVLAFGVIAIVLAGVGLYGVLTYSVAQRTNEIGVRLALGAEPRTVRRSTVRQALRLVAAGLFAGVSAALLTAPALRSLLFGVSPRDLPTVAAVCAVVTAVALLAAYLPARRASRVDPMVALRCE